MYSRRIQRNGQVSIPKLIQTKLSLTEGEYLFLYKQYHTIVLEKHHANETLNQCIFRDGKVSIPAELRRILGITLETRLSLDYSASRGQIIIKIVGNENVYNEV